MKSVLHVGLIAPGGYTSEAMMRGFFQNNFTSYHLFDFQAERYNYGLEGMRQQLLKQAALIKPDLIFLHIQNSEILDYETARTLSSISFTVLYTFDVRDSMRTEWMYKMCEHIKLVCFACKEDVDVCVSRGYTNAVTIHSSCDMDSYKRLPKFPFEYKVPEVVFVGNNYVNTNLNFELADLRQRYVYYLKVHLPDGLFNAYGINWGSGFENKMINPQQEINLYNNTAIALNFNNYLRTDYTSDRVWRIMSCGTFCLTMYFPGIEKIFQRGVHLDWFETKEELTSKISHYLIDATERNKIAMSGMELVRSEHTWGKRIKQILGAIPAPAPCRETHTIDGNIPMDDDEKYDGRVCDCGKLKWTWEECGCVDKKMKLRASQNS